MVRKRPAFVLIGGAVLLVGALWWGKNRWFGSLPLSASPLSAPSPDAIWPLKGAKTRVLHTGVTQTSTVTNDGTHIDLFDFDFSKNPNLRWEIFDQDEDDETPLDNHVLYWKRNVAKATKQLNASGRGPVVAAWNGAFFGYDKKNDDIAFHVSPVVLRGKCYFNNAMHRWVFGVKQTSSGPVWKVFHQPSRLVMEKEFDYAAGALQCLVLNGKPLLVEPFPQTREEIKDQPVPSTPAEAGHIPIFDHMRTSRSSMGWSQDNRHLYFLAVKEPDSEGGSSSAFTYSLRGFTLPGGTTLGGGWTVTDVQKFWLSKGVWGAVNSDAGDVLQWVAQQPSGNYDFEPSRQASNKILIRCGKNWKGAEAGDGGGSMMYFMVRQSASSH